MQSQINHMFTRFGPPDLRPRSSPRGDLHYHTGFSTLTRKTFTPHNMIFQLIENFTIHTHNVTTLTTTSSVGFQPVSPSSVRNYNLPLGITTYPTPLGMTPSLTTHSSRYTSVLQSVQHNQAHNTNKFVLYNG